MWLIRYAINFTDEITYTSGVEQGIVIAKDFADACRRLEEYYGGLNEVLKLEWIGEEVIPLKDDTLKIIMSEVE